MDAIKHIALDKTALTATKAIASSKRTLTKRRNPFLSKEERARRQKKRARIIARNISFKGSEETLREHLQKYGEIDELNLLKRSDGKLVGCAFVQFETVNQATKAILKGNNQPYLGRPIFLDWALAKDEYTAKKEEVKLDNPEEKPTVELMDEDGSEYENDADSKAAYDDNSQGTASIKSESEDEKDGEESQIDNGEGDINTLDDCKTKKDIKTEINLKIKKEKHISNDVQEGCTIFLKNVSFDASEDDLRKLCRKFGSVCYALINREPISGHPKGTAFVKFKTPESAELCLRAGTEFMLMDQILEPHPAISRDEIRTQSLEKSKKDNGKDARNLFLVREGLIMTGSKAAEGVSASDMAKRHKLEQIKTQVLKNLNRFVSRNRLSIHNLPLNYDDEALKQMITAYTGFRPHECRVMRENKITTEHPKGKSKGFGFMSFSSHQEALTALRKLNNNPKIFSDVHRPIVAFSIEDRAVHKIKENRKKKSKLNNPTYQQKLAKRKEQRTLKLSTNKEPKGALLRRHNTDDKSKLKKHIKSVEQKHLTNKASTESLESFVGMAGKPGSSIRMRSKKKIKEQSDEHLKRVRTEKRKEKQRKLRQIHLSERKAIIRPKQGRRTERDELVQLVQKYKHLIDKRNAATLSSQLNIAEQKRKPKRTKWYTD